MCGGRGTRLMPYTSDLPKALITVGRLPMLEIIVRQLKFYNFSHITFSVYHLSANIVNYFGDGSKWGLTIDYSLEDFPLGTAGPLKLLNDLPENFLVINCDILADLDLTAFFDFHVQSNNIFSIAGYKKSYKIPYGVLHTGSSGKLSRMEEKPETVSINAGIYIAHKSILNVIPSLFPFDMDKLIRKLIDSDEAIAVYPFEGYWQDIGNEEEYKKAIADLPLLGLEYVQNH